VALVGTRKPSPAAARYASHLAGELSRAGVVVASGGAVGIDASAHRGALDAGGRTVVVAPSGWSHPYPAHHGPLFESIVQAGGAHLSPFEGAVVARRHQFFRRNELLVALCHVLVVVQAPLRSGALNAAKHARELGRPCFVAPAPPWSPRGAGCTAELSRGALPLSGAADVLRALDELGLPRLGGESDGAGAEDASHAVASGSAPPGISSATLLSSSPSCRNLRPPGSETCVCLTSGSR
jgi:DNA processing protein